VKKTPLAASRPGSTKGRPVGLTGQLRLHLGRKPQIGRHVYIASGAVVVGDVTLGDHSSVWYNAVLRGDINRIVVGQFTNIQDNAVLHLADDFACEVGDYVTIGHAAVVHACRVGNECLIGMGAVVLDGAVVGDRCIIGARTLVSQGARIPPHSLVLGTPGRVVRKLTAQEQKRLRLWAVKYSRMAAWYSRQQINMGGPR